MPCTVIKRDELGEMTLTVYQQVGRHLQVCNFFKIGVTAGIEGIGKKITDMGPSKLARRQADIMNH